MGRLKCLAQGHDVRAERGEILTLWPTEGQSLSRPAWLDSFNKHCIMLPSLFLIFFFFFQLASSESIRIFPSLLTASLTASPTPLIRRYLSNVFEWKRTGHLIQMIIVDWKKYYTVHKTLSGHLEVKILTMKHSYLLVILYYFITQTRKQVAFKTAKLLVAFQDPCEVVKISSWEANGWDTWRRR